MQVAIVQDQAVQLAVCLLLGIFSGYFAGRGLVFWRVQALRRAS